MDLDVSKNDVELRFRKQTERIGQLAFESLVSGTLTRP